MFVFGLIIGIVGTGIIILVLSFLFKQTPELRITPEPRPVSEVLKDSERRRLLAIQSNPEVINWLKEVS